MERRDRLRPGRILTKAEFASLERIMEGNYWGKIDNRSGWFTIDEESLEVLSCEAGGPDTSFDQVFQAIRKKLKIEEAVLQLISAKVRQMAS